MRSFIRASVVAAVAAVPAVALAQAGVNGTSGFNFVTVLGNAVNSLVPIVAGIALIGFFWGLAMYVFGAGDEKRKTEGKNIMIWGLLAIFIIFSLYGIIALLQQTFFGQQYNGNNQLTAPTVQNVGGGR